jgi:hypothetical protein
MRIACRNYDISHIFIDSLIRSPNRTTRTSRGLPGFPRTYGNKHGIQFTVTISADIRKTSAGVAKYNQA